MDVGNYCERLREDMTVWKAKIYDIIRRVEKASAEDRQKFASTLDELNNIMDNIEGGVRKLENQCPLDWEPERAALEEKSRELSTKSDQVMRELSPDDFE